MSNTDCPTAPQTRLFNRRTALRLAFTAVPVGAAVIWPTISSAGSASAAQISIIDAVSQTSSAAFTLGVTKPSAANTGVAAGSALTVVNGDLNMVAGRTYQNLDIRGFVNGAAGATLLNSLVRGRGTGYVSPGLVNGNSNTVGMKISRCTLLPDVSRYFLNGFNGSNCLVERCDISNVVDAIHATGDNVLVHGNFIHDFSFFDGSTGTDHANDAVHPGWTHNDAIQHMGGNGLQFIGNNVQAYFSTTSGTPNTALRTYPRRNYCNGITITPSAGRVSGLKISQNWLEGGDVLLQIPAQSRGYDSGNNGEISYNRCGIDQKPIGSGRRIQMRSTSGMGTYTGLDTNTFDTVASVPTAYQGKPLIAQAGSGNGTPGISLSLIP